MQSWLSVLRLCMPELAISPEALYAELAISPETLYA